VSRGIALLFSRTLGTRWGWGSATRSGHLYPREKNPVPTVQEAGWAPWTVWTGGKPRPHRDSIPDSRSLYRLSYPAHSRPHFLAVKTQPRKLRDLATCLRYARRPPCGWDLASIEAYRVGGMAALLDGNW